MIRNALLSLALAGAMCAQQPPPPGPGHGPGDEEMKHPGDRGMRHPGPGMMFKALGLSPDQEKAIQTLTEKRRMGGMPRPGPEEESLRAAAEDPSTTEAQLRTLHAAASEAHLKALLDRRALAVEINALLTPEQQAKARRIRENMRKEMEARMSLMEDLGGPGEPGPYNTPRRR